MGLVKLQDARMRDIGPAHSPAVIIGGRAFFWDAIPDDVRAQLGSDDLELLRELTAEWEGYLGQRNQCCGARGTRVTSGRRFCGVCNREQK
jgi:hypothetical protein